MDAGEAGRVAQTVVDEVGGAVIVDDAFLRRIVVTVIAGGHVLLEDVPGTGKTLTARSVARALGLEFSRLQFTPDLLPGDVTGSNVYDEQRGVFEFVEGPVFANVVLADEINRAPPKTQAAMLEAMEERQVTVDGNTYDLPDPYFVLATQNPVEQEGTFPLPEAQVDRFWLKDSVGYPDRAGEKRLLDRRAARDAGIPTVQPVVSAVEVRELQAVPERVTVDDDLRWYVADLARGTREHRHTEVGVSPRGTQRLFEVARARAVFDGRDYVVPADVADIAPYVLAHRLVLTAQARMDDVEKAAVVAEVLEDIEVPNV